MTFFQLLIRGSRILLPQQPNCFGAFQKVIIKPFVEKVDDWKYNFIMNRINTSPVRCGCIFQFFFQFYIECNLWYHHCSLLLDCSENFPPSLQLIAFFYFIKSKLLKYSSIWLKFYHLRKTDETSYKHIANLLQSILNAGSPCLSISGRIN